VKYVKGETKVKIILDSGLVWCDKAMKFVDMWTKVWRKAASWGGGGPHTIS